MVLSCGGDARALIVEDVEDVADDTGFEEDCFEVLEDDGGFNGGGFDDGGFDDGGFDDGCFEVADAGTGGGISSCLCMAAAVSTLAELACFVVVGFVC